MARGTGFAQTPGLFNVLVFLPVVGTVIAVLVFFWQLACMVVAVRQSLDYTSTLRAFFVILIALIPVIIINAIIFSVLRIGVQTPEVAVEGAKSILTVVQTLGMAG